MGIFFRGVNSLEMIVPYQQLSPETLHRLVGDFVCRDGSVQGHQDQSLERQIEEVMVELRAGRVVLVYDDELETCNIVPADGLV